MSLIWWSSWEIVLSRIHIWLMNSWEKEKELNILLQIIVSDQLGLRYLIEVENIWLGHHADITWYIDFSWIKNISFPDNAIESDVHSFFPFICSDFICFIFMSLLEIVGLVEIVKMMVILVSLLLHVYKPKYSSFCKLYSISFSQILFTFSLIWALPCFSTWY